MIDLINCKHRRLYRLNSRNLTLGVFNNRSKGFTGYRIKFGCKYLFEEFHWDTGASYGTARPYEELNETVPKGIQVLAILSGARCRNCHERVLYDSAKMQWNHWRKSDCLNIIPISRENTKLEAWMTTMEKKYEHV